MSRFGARRGAAMTAIVGLGVLTAIARADAAKTPATPAPATCGAPVSSWGGATADDVSVELLGVERLDASPPATPRATPAATESPTVFVELRIENLGDTPATVAVADITLNLCDGTSIGASTDTRRPPLPDGPLPAGETRQGWVAFAIGVGELPVRLVVPVSRPGLVGGRVEFPLVDVDAGTTAAGPPASPGITGADAHGGDAYGGDGADGADATGEAGDPEGP